MISLSECYALLQVLLVDLALAGDNAIVIGLVAASVPAELRKKVIVVGIVIATVLRILFSLGAVQLLKINGLMLIGGVLLFWVAWKLWQEIRKTSMAHETANLAGMNEAPPKTFAAALFQVVLADVSMSLDNVLAVAGAAREHLWVLVVGLSVSVALMAFASTKIAGLLKTYPWIAYLGLAVIFLIAGHMVFDGAMEVYAKFA